MSDNVYKHVDQWYLIVCPACGCWGFEGDPEDPDGIFCGLHDDDEQMTRVRCVVVKVRPVSVEEESAEKLAEWIEQHPITKLLNERKERRQCTDV